MERMLWINMFEHSDMYTIMVVDHSFLDRVEEQRFESNTKIYPISSFSRTKVRKTLKKAYKQKAITYAMDDVDPRVVTSTDDQWSKLNDQIAKFDHYFIHYNGGGDMFASFFSLKDLSKETIALLGTHDQENVRLFFRQLARFLK